MRYYFIKSGTLPATVVTYSVGRQSGSLAGVGEKRLLTIPEAARELGMSRVVVWRLVKRGTLPSIGTERVRLIDADVLECFRKKDRPTGRPPGSKPTP